MQHEAGYICAMLFIIPGFPFITSGIDLAKLDMRSGVERFTYALIVVLVATMSAWIMALILHLQPVDFEKMSLPLEAWILFRLLASFCGVFGFSVMFNSPVRLAAVAAGIGAVANTFRPGAGGSYGMCHRQQRHSWGFGCRSAGFSDQKQGWISENLCDSAVNRNHGTRTLFISGIL